jgi:hypothetical protein
LTVREVKKALESEAEPAEVEEGEVPELQEVLENGPRSLRVLFIEEAKEVRARPTPNNTERQKIVDGPYDDEVRGFLERIKENGRLDVRELLKDFERMRERCQEISFVLNERNCESADTIHEQALRYYDTWDENYIMFMSEFENMPENSSVIIMIEEQLGEPYGNLSVEKKRIAAFMIYEDSLPNLAEAEMKGREWDDWVLKGGDSRRAFLLQELSSMGYFDTDSRRLSRAVLLQGKFDFNQLPQSVLQEVSKLNFNEASKLQERYELLEMRFEGKSKEWVDIISHPESKLFEERIDSIKRLPEEEQVEVWAKAQLLPELRGSIIAMLYNEAVGSDMKLDSLEPKQIVVLYALIQEERITV